MVSRSYDTILTLLEDAYDSLISPKYIVRKDTNKLHLIFKAFAKGLDVIFGAVLALKYRFDPTYCDDDDLASTAKIVGTKMRSGTRSCLRITILNTNTISSKTFIAGEYVYDSSSGEQFTFDVAYDTVIASEATIDIISISQDVGNFPVSSSDTITITRVDEASIDTSFEFSCVDNSDLLGVAAETNYTFRQRILTDTARQDEIQEIQEEIRRLSGIFDCNCAFNESNTPVEYDGITLAAKELLVVITGSPSSEIADIVARKTLYKTHMIDAGLVVYFNSVCYIGGKYPVYYMFHGATNFTLAIEYQYDPVKLKIEQVEDELTDILSMYINPNTHVDVITEYDIYSKLVASGLAAVVILNVNILVSGAEVPYVTIPKTRIPKLTSIAFTPVSV